jgi:hypothetical protein
MGAIAIMAKHHPERPRDPNQLAKRIIEIATGEVEDRLLTLEEQGKDRPPSLLGAEGWRS